MQSEMAEKGLPMAFFWFASPSLVCSVFRERYRQRHTAIAHNLAFCMGTFIFFIPLFPQLKRRFFEAWLVH